MTPLLLPSRARVYAARKVERTHVRHFRAMGSSSPLGLGNHCGHANAGAWATRAHTTYLFHEQTTEACDMSEKRREAARAAVRPRDGEQRLLPGRLNCWRHGNLRGSGWEWWNKPGSAEFFSHPPICPEITGHGGPVPPRRAPVHAKRPTRKLPLLDQTPG